MTHQVKWVSVELEEPPAHTFKPLWWWDGEIVGMGTYRGRPGGMLDGWGKDGWETGLAHGRITHWAEIVDPLPPGGEG